MVCKSAWARGSIVGSGTMLKAGRSQVRFSMESLNCLNSPNSSSRNMALGLTQPLKETSAGNLPGSKERPACKADVLSIICEQTVDCGSPVDPNLNASLACYRENFNFFCL
jgi:hypothetical protein